jgi:hypothetical protein
MARFDDAYSHQDGSEGESDWKTTLHDTIAAGREGMTHEEEMRKVLEEAAAIRPRLTNKSDLAMLDSLVARLRGDAKGGLTAIADEIGITKGAASKVAQRLKKRVAGQAWKLSRKSVQYIGEGEKPRAIAGIKATWSMNQLNPT